MNEGERAAFAAHPYLHRLAALRDRGGWRFVHREDASGNIDLTTGHRAWPDGSADIVNYTGPTEARAWRTNHDGAVVWTRVGRLVDVVDGLLELPPPNTPDAPRLVLGTTVPLWTP